jgi:hypothetical protein
MGIRSSELKRTSKNLKFEADKKSNLSLHAVNRDLKFAVQWGSWKFLEVQ